MRQNLNKTKTTSIQTVASQKISFDFDGTLTQKTMRDLATNLLKSGVQVYIITSRWSDCMKDVYELAKKIGIKTDNVYATNNKDKGDFILKNALDIDIHFDDDFFDIDSINRKTKTMGVLIALDLHPTNNFSD